jgi:uncharacterized protein (TIGR03084 family)
MPPRGDVLGMPSPDEIVTDLIAEHRSLDAVLDVLSPRDWDAPTPAEGWAVRDQVSHLAFFDEAATTASRDPDRFLADTARALADGGDPMAAHLARGRGMDPEELLGWWQGARRELIEAVSSVEPGTRIPWYGPPMGVISFVTARLMETWAHGQDVVDAVGVHREPTARLRHVAHMGVAARPFSYQVRGLAPPDTPVLVELVGPAGERWVFGEDSPSDKVRGPALDFCLVVTQRRHLADTGLVVVGPAATEWMSIAQAFAGPPGTGRRPGQFA